MKARLGLRELASMAGCSSTAVSMALRNHPRIGVETREKIQQLAREHGYTRDPVVSALMNRLRTARCRTADRLGVVTWWKTREGEQARPLGARLHQGIRGRANHLGYDVEYFWAKEPGMTAKRLSAILHTRAIHGIILCNVPYARGHASLDWAHFAAASLGSGIVKPALPRATFSCHQAMLLALRHLRRKGYRRVGYLNLASQEELVQDSWRSAYLGYCYRKEKRITIPPLLVPDWNKARIGAWLKKYKPDGVVSNVSRFYFLIQDLGYKIPQDIGFATLDHVAEEIPAAAGIRQPREWLGAKLVDLVVERLENHEFGLPEIPETVLLHGFWQDGPTLLRRKK